MFFTPPAGQHVRPCGAHGFGVAEGAPHGLHGRSHVEGIRLGGGNQGGAGRRNGPARLGDPPRKRGGHGALNRPGNPVGMTDHTSGLVDCCPHDAEGFDVLAKPAG